MPTENNNGSEIANQHFIPAPVNLNVGVAFMKRFDDDIHDYTYFHA